MSHQAPSLSPVGTILFMSLNRMVKRTPADEEPSVYTVVLEFDGKTTEGKAFKEEIQQVNPQCVRATEGTKYKIKFSGKFAPKVLDSEGTEISAEDIPSFTRGTTGTASAVFKKYTNNPKGGSLALTHVQLVTLDNSNAEPTTTLDSVVQEMIKSRALKG